jgi:hypothetical protein
MKICILLLSALALVFGQGTAEDNAPFTGYLVNAQWDGRTFPSDQWALDITRQSVLWRPQQELKYTNLIPMRDGSALSPTYTAFEPKTRSYFIVTQRDTNTASLWGIVISGDTNTSKSLGPEVRFTYPEPELPLQGIQTWNNNGQILVLAIFKNCTILQVDYKTGSTSLWANICNDTRTVTTAIDISSNEMFVLTQNEEGPPMREIVIVNLASKQYESNLIQPLKNHNETDEEAFEMQWLPTLKNLMVFYTGNFDQLIYTEPHSGMTNWAIFDLAEYQGEQGNLEFETDDDLESDDTWTDSALDPVTGKLWFQCSDVDPDSGLFTTTLCQIQIPARVQQLNFVNVAIWPMTYGYAGMQWVPIQA